MPDLPMHEPGAPKPAGDAIQRGAEEGRGLAGILRTRIPMPFSVRAHLPRARTWRDVVREAALPAELGSLVGEVIRRSRLWRSERREVARELCAHFADGVLAGRSPAELIADFGPVKPSAKLISRAARRKRPLWWKTWRLGLKSAACGILLCIALYAVLFVVVMVGKPVVTRHFAVESNQRLEKTPASQRAWPLYQSIKKDLGEVPMDLMNYPMDSEGKPDISTGDAWPQQRTHARWAQAAAWVDARQEPIERLRRAAVMPVLGCPMYSFTGSGSPWTRALASNQGADLTELVPAGPDTSLLSIVLPFAADARYLGRILVVDARRALELKDSARFAADADALIGIVNQAGEDHALISQLVRIAVLHLTEDVLKEGLMADLLSEEQLTRLAHRLGALGDGAVRVTYDTEKEFLLDLLQRAYTDDGNGGGHMTYEGMKLLSTITSLTTPDDADAAEQRARKALVLKALSPVALVVSAGRKETVALADELYAAAQTEADTPYWQRAEGSQDLVVARLHERSSGITGKHTFLAILMPAFGSAATASQQARQERDAMLVTLALEVYRKKHGMYPARLAELVPGLLPTLPADVFDGLPIKYTLVGDGSTAKPVVYSVGADRMDDGGVGPADPNWDTNMHHYRSAANVKAWLAAPGTGATIRGDWILYDPAKVAGRLAKPNTSPTAAPTAPAATTPASSPESK